MGRKLNTRVSPSRAPQFGLTKDDTLRLRSRVACRVVSEIQCDEKAVAIVADLIDELMVCEMQPSPDAGSTSTSRSGRTTPISAG